MDTYLGYLIAIKFYLVINSYLNSTVIDIIILSSSLGGNSESL